MEINCENGCQSTFLRKDKLSHDGKCPQATVSCPFAKHGCQTLIKRCDFNDHQVEAAVSHSSLLASAITAVKSDALLGKVHVSGSQIYTD